MKKGFTLIELLGVIAILGVLALIAIPVIDTSLNQSKDKLAISQEKQIIKGAKDLLAEHLKCLPNSKKTCDISCASNCGNNKKTCTISVSCLQKSGYVDINLKNPQTGKDYNATAEVQITSYNDNFKYKFNGGEDDE